MTSIFTDTEDRMAIAPRSSHLPDMQEYDPLAGLPEGYELVTFTNFKKLAQAAIYIFNQLDTHEDEGNQFLVVLGLSSHARDRLINRKDNLGVSFRFMWDGSIGILKVLPSRTHSATTSELRAEIAEKIDSMGVHRLQTAWGSTTTHEGTVSTKGKEADESFHPPPRFPVPGQQSEPWPTLVIETGVSESLAKLREDAKWWFNNSNGDVRIVLILSIKKRTRTVLLEKWQLAPPVPQGGMMTHQMINTLHQRHPQPMPPLAPQPAAQRMPYSLQEITITPTSASGSLILPFEALFCRAPLGNEADIILNPQDLINCIRFVF
jgi:hypothetical protein